MINAMHDVTLESIQAALDGLHLPFRALEAHKGPALTRFILEPVGPLNITALGNATSALAMALCVRDVSIVAPLPGTGLIGLDVPNHKPDPVSFEDMFASPAMQEAASPLAFPLAFPLGKDVTGNPVICDLATLHHLLITGVAGSGKSVCIQSMLLSLLRRNTEKDLQLVLFDAHNEYPQAITAAPHLQMPVITDVRQAVDALTAAAEEATKRISLYHQAHATPNIDKYNQQVPEDQRLPHIVIVVDGLEPLMMDFPRKMEMALCQLGRFGSAAGVHLVAATQLLYPPMRTSILQGSIPSRISFRLPTATDSHACLQRSGAEKLLSPGDMLYKPRGEFVPIRVQGCFIREEEVDAFTRNFREHYPPNHNVTLLDALLSSAQQTEPAAPSPREEFSDTDLLIQAIEYAVQDRQISPSMLQRRLSIGYDRAARLIDQMEAMGILSAKDGAKPRLCLINAQEFEIMKAKGVFHHEQ